MLFLLVCPAGLRQRMPGSETGFRKYQKADARQRKKTVLRGLWGKSELTVREAGKLAVAKHTLHLSLLSPCILLILPRS
ncbi:hypothetical protein ABZQ40_30855, partial [Pseudomonas aeruginosa]